MTDFVQQAGNQNAKQEKAEAERLLNERKAVIDKVVHPPGSPAYRKYTPEDYEKIKKYFIKWLCLPSDLRNPSTQNEFAELFGINKNTVSGWRKSEKVQREVDRGARFQVWDEIPAVIRSMLEKAKEGSYQHQRLAFELALMLDDTEVKRKRRMDDAEAAAESQDGDGSDPFGMSMDELIEVSRGIITSHDERAETVEESGK